MESRNPSSDTSLGTWDPHCCCTRWHLPAVLPPPCCCTLQCLFTPRPALPAATSQVCPLRTPALRTVLQYYALGVPAAGALDVYVAIDAAPERLGYLATNTANRDADWLTDRVVEAVLLESLIQWQRKSGLVRVTPLFPAASVLPTERCAPGRADGCI